MLTTASPLLSALILNLSSTNPNSNSNSTSLVPNRTFEFIYLIFSAQERIVILSNFIARQLQEWFIQEFAEDLDGTIKVNFFRYENSFLIRADLLRFPISSLKCPQECFLIIFHFIEH